jgi:hypothetical protein
LLAKPNRNTAKSTARNAIIATATPLPCSWLRCRPEGAFDPSCVVTFWSCGDASQPALRAGSTAPPAGRTKGIAKKRI